MSKKAQKESATLSFEQSLEELERIVEQLDDGNLSLEAMLELFERGIHLSRECRQRLDAAERRVELLVKGPDNTRTLVAFTELDNASNLGDVEDVE